MKIFKPIFKHWSYMADLVVIILGIVIALSLDAWWQDKQDKKTEIALLDELRRNCAQRIDDLKYDLNWWEQAKNGCDSILCYIDEPHKMDIPIGNYLKNMLLINSAEITTSAFKSIESIGWQIISNDSIRKWADWVFENQYQTLIERHDRQALRLIEHTESFYYKLFDGESGEPFNSNFALKNPEFKGHILILKNAWLDGITIMNDDIKAAKYLNSIINGELNKLNKGGDSYAFD